MVANWLRKKSYKMKPGVFRLLGNLYAPFRGARIRITQAKDNYRYLRVEMPLTPLNANFVGTQFGGSMYMMTDPFYMIQLIQILGPDYVVWDKAARIDFIKPGRRRLVTEFTWTEEEIDQIKVRTNNGDKLLLDKEVRIEDETGELIATVIKTLYIRKKELVSPPN